MPGLNAVPDLLISIIRKEQQVSAHLIRHAGTQANVSLLQLVVSCLGNFEILKFEVRVDAFVVCGF
ncbi:hypothetical protein J2Z66_002086 [Paenibacillus eucommiae]|uniref:Uncharacterized protein n=1 Tax=Paenibacillus eucommiae TaxID=1355755 RepID=A0ABS4ISC9_9BACL|nr:hypothetical protein [Paenibacillus eucommiae]